VGERDESPLNISHWTGTVSIACTLAHHQVEDASTRTRVPSEHPVGSRAALSGPQVEAKIVH
jgi:hypothetical protein